MRSAGAGLLIATTLLAGCADPCHNDSFSEFRSPMGQRKVVVFRRSCGATTGFSTQASLLASNASVPENSGNLLAVDDDHGKVALDGSGRIEVRVAFADESTVTLEYPARARVFAQVVSREGVAIRYEHLAPALPRVTE